MLKTIEIDESLVSRLNVACDFCNTTPITENGSIRKIEHTNLTFNYSNEIYVHNLDKKINNYVIIYSGGIL